MALHVEVAMTQKKTHSMLRNIVTRGHCILNHLCMLNMLKTVLNFLERWIINIAATSLTGVINLIFKSILTDIYKYTPILLLNVQYNAVPGCVHIHVFVVEV